MSFIILYFDIVALYNSDIFPQIHFDNLQALYNEKSEKQKKQKIYDLKNLKNHPKIRINLQYFFKDVNKFFLSYHIELKPH